MSTTVASSPSLLPSLNSHSMNLHSEEDDSRFLLSAPLHDSKFNLQPPLEACHPIRKKSSSLLLTDRPLNSTSNPSPQATSATTTSTNPSSETLNAFKYASKLTVLHSSRAATATSGSYSSSSSILSNSDNSPSPVTPSSPPIETPHHVPQADSSNQIISNLALHYPRPRRISPLFQDDSAQIGNTTNHKNDSHLYGTDDNSNSLNEPVDGAIFTFELSPGDTHKTSQTSDGDVSSHYLDDSFAHHRNPYPQLGSSLRSPYSSSISSSPSSSCSSSSSILAASPLSATSIPHMHSAPSSANSRSPAIAIALPSPRPLPAVLSRAMQLTSRVPSTQSTLSASFAPRSVNQPPLMARLAQRRSSADVYGSQAALMHQASAMNSTYFNHHNTHPLRDLDNAPLQSHLRSPLRPLPNEHHVRTFSGPAVLHNRISPTTDPMRRTSNVINLNSKVIDIGTSQNNNNPVIVKTEDALFDLEL